jgi:photosystem II stability/assembly factor-like uncharacterized protein
LYKSTDFGATWTLLSSQAIFGVQGWYSQYVAVHPTDSTQVVRGGQNLYKSTNGGVSSSGVSGPWADHHNYAHHPTNPNILYVVDDGGVWRSTNFGSSYQDVGAGLRTSQFYNGCSDSGTDSLLVAGSVQDHFGYIYRGTFSWENHSSGMDEIGWTAINQSNDQIMYAGNRGGGAISKSTNRGSTFSSSSSGITSGAASWNAPFVLSKSNSNYLYFGRTIIYKTTNAGTSWTATNGGAALDGNLPLSMAVAPTNQDTVFVGNVPGVGRSRIFRTTNGGTSWTDVTGNLPNRYPLDIAIDPRDSRIVYVAFGGFDTTRVGKSTDAGLTWAHISSPLPNVPATALAIDPFNTNHVYAGTDLGVFVSTDGGSTWTSFNDGLPEAVIVGDLLISPSDRSIRVATHSNGVFTRKLLSTAPTGVGEETHGVPAQYALDQNYPNPFNPSTKISYSVPPLAGRDLVRRADGQLTAVSFVRLSVYDVLGREVATLVDEAQAPGAHEVIWDARNVASGVYLYRLTAGSFVETRKMLLVH